MSEPHLSAGAALGAAVAGASVTAALEHAAVAFFGIPLAAVTAAMTGALVPALLLEGEPLLQALRRWLGSVALSLVATALLLHLLGLERVHAIGVASKLDLLTLFLRDDSYAISLMPDPVARLTLRANIVAGMNLLDAATHVTLTLPYAASFTSMLLDEGIPAPFRLTASERDAILSLTITDDERP